MPVPCPCCAKPSLSEPHVWEVCPGCGWTDDPQQSADPDEQDGANGISLNDARRNVLEFGRFKRPASP